MQYYFRAHAANTEDLRINPSKKSFLVSIGNIGKAYMLLKQYDSAWFYADMYYTKSKNADLPIGVASALLQMGNIYFEMGEYNLALEYYRSSLPWYTRISNLYNVSAYMAQVFEKTGNLDSALRIVCCLLTY